VSKGLGRKDAATKQNQSGNTAKSNQTREIKESRNDDRAARLEIKVACIGLIGPVELYKKKANAFI